MNQQTYPANSQKSKKAEKNVVKVVNSKVQVKKKPLGKRIMGVFAADGENVDNVVSYMIYDVLVPAAKSAVSDMISGGIDQLLYGGSRKPNNMYRSRGVSRPRTNYGGSYFGNTAGNRQPVTYTRRSKSQYEDLIFDNRSEAEEVISQMIDLIDTYGAVSVADLYTMTGLDSNFTDDNIGWTNLNSATVKRDGRGYVMSLPRVEDLR